LSHILLRQRHYWPLLAAAAFDFAIYYADYCRHYADYAIISPLHAIIAAMLILFRQPLRH
jgi:hypothetical protein